MISVVWARVWLRLLVFPCIVLIEMEGATWTGYTYLIFVVIFLHLFINHHHIDIDDDAMELDNEETAAMDYLRGMEDDKENCVHVRSINNVTQGVDLTPENPKHATFKYYRHYTGSENDEPFFKKIPRELLDFKEPSAPPTYHPKASIAARRERYDQTLDHMKSGTLHEYRYDGNEFGEYEMGNHIKIQIPESGGNVSLKMTFTKPEHEEKEVLHNATTTRKVVQRIALNPDHPEYERLKNLSAEEIIEEAHKLSLSTEIKTPNLPDLPPEKSNEPYSSKKYEHTIKVTETSPAPAPLSPSTIKPVASPPAPSPSDNLKMPRNNNKKGKNKKGNCNGSCVVLSQACRVHKAVLDSLEFVSDLLRIIDETFDELRELKVAFESYSAKNMKELCASCGAMHNRGLTKTGFQRDHNDLVEAFYQTVSDIRDRMEILLADCAVEKEKIMAIINAAHTLAEDRGEEDETGEMHSLGESLFDIYEPEILGYDEMETEYKKDRPFIHMDEFRHPKNVKLAEDAAKLADAYAAIAANEAEIAELDAETAQKEKEMEAERPRTAAIMKRERRKVERDAENARQLKWHNDSVKMKLRALVEYDMDEPVDVEEKEPNREGSIRWWMELAREDNIKDGGSGNLFGSIIRTRKTLENGELVSKNGEPVEWDDEELEKEMSRL